MRRNIISNIKKLWSFFTVRYDVVCVLFLIFPLMQGCATTILWSTEEADYKTVRSADVTLALQTEGDFENTRTRVWVDYGEAKDALVPAINDPLFMARFPHVYSALNERNNDQQREQFSPVFGPVPVIMRDAHLVLGVDKVSRHSWLSVEASYDWPRYTVSMVKSGALQYQARTMEDIPVSLKKRAANYSLYSRPFARAVEKAWHHRIDSTEVPIDYDKVLVWQQADGTLSDVADWSKQYTAFLVSLEPNEHDMEFVKVSFESAEADTRASSGEGSQLVRFNANVGYDRAAAQTPVRDPIPVRRKIPAKLLVTRRESEFMYPAAVRVMLTPLSAVVDYYTWPLQMFFLFSVWAE